MIVDVHTHVELKLSQREREHFVDVPGYEDFLTSFTRDMSFERYWKAMEPVEKAIIVNGRYELDQPVSLNDEVAKLASAHPEKLIAFCGVMPDEPHPGGEVWRCVTELGMKGVKILPVLQRHPPNHRKYYPVYEAAQALRVPISVHMGTHFLPYSRLVNSQPLLLEDVAMDFPDLKIICAHLGHPWIEDTIALVRKAPNLYTDISGLMLPDHRRTFSLVYRGLVLAYEYGVLDKVLFGSDYPANTPGDCMRKLESINHFANGTELPRVPDEALHDILYENWKNVIEV